MNRMVNILRTKEGDEETCIHNIHTMETVWNEHMVLFSKSKAYTYERKIWELLHGNP